MDVQQFVEESLRQIIDGVRAAQDHAAKHGGSVSPPRRYRRGSIKGRAEVVTGDPKPQEVEFDVAVVTDQSSEQGGGGGLRVAGVFSAGAEAKGQSGTSSSSRVRFSVQLRLPAQRAE